MPKYEIQKTASDILIYQTEDGKTRIDVKIENNTVWLTQSMITKLYQTTKQNISLHLKNIYKEGELSKNSTVKEYLTVQTEGNRQVQRQVEYYSLDVIIALGYRVKSHIGTQFRRWATERLNEYLIKGFTMDDQRLKEGRSIGADYFDELLERIRDIRSSEKRFYKKITDIYQLSIDYEPASEITQEFFATVQNKLHYAIHGHTAAELIAERAKSDKSNMGLTSWKGTKVREPDVLVAKNYLSEDELKNLNRIVNMYLDYAEDQARIRNPMYMKDWAEKLDAFLKFNQRDVLKNAGKISAQVAKTIALEQYKKFSDRRVKETDTIEDKEFDKIVKKITKKDK